MSYYDYAPYVSVAEKRAKAEKKLAQMKKKNPGIRPVSINGNALATTWWGKEWNKNLERYADYSNRIGRGRSYVRHGAVLDLQITPGNVKAIVQGSRSKPYDVHIRISSIPERNWADITSACMGKFESLQTLIAGKFPKELTELFTKKGSGLFPSPDDITFDCSCPDWASMCKHVAAVLYGIGTRLDEDPNLFFVLRNLDTGDLISQAIKESKNDLLSKATRKTSRVLETETDLSAMFGIDLGDEVADETPLKPSKTTKVSQAKQTRPVKRKDVGSVKPTPSKPLVTPKKAAPKTAPVPAIDALSILEVLIKKKKNGITVSEIIASSGMDDIKVRNTLFRLKKLGIIESVERGVYRSCKVKK